jgi:putative transcriptional regulator
MTKQYRSPVMASIHETVEGLHAAGVMDKQTMRKFDEACLTPVRPLTPEEIRALREREGASQAVFARYLNVTTGLISQWERGEKHPQGALLSLVARHGLGTVAYSSFCSSSSAPISRVMAPSLGKMPTTSLRRLISPLRHSPLTPRTVSG